MLLSDKYPFLTDYFTKAAAGRRKAALQSLLFYGNDFDSQYALSKEIARLLNCSSDKSDDCECLNCRWIRENTHPAVLTISRLDNKPEDDESKTVISIKQAQLIKEKLFCASEFHRVLIFCDRDDDGNISGLNPQNFQAEAANSLLKIIEEPQPDITFIFITRYVEDVLATIASRSQCFFVPSHKTINYCYDCIKGIFTDYFNFARKDVFDVSQNLTDLTKEHSVQEILDGIQNYMLELLKTNPEQYLLIKHIELAEKAKQQAKLGMKAANIFDELCLNIIH